MPKLVPFDIPGKAGIALVKRSFLQIADPMDRSPGHRYSSICETAKACLKQNAGCLFALVNTVYGSVKGDRDAANL
jgi:hypothetical protein